MELRTIFICLWYISFLIKCSRLQWELSTLNCHLLPFFIWLIDSWLAVHRSVLLPKESRFFKCVHSCVILKSLWLHLMQPVPAPIPSGCLELLEDFDILNAEFCFWNKVQNVSAFKICVCVCLLCNPSSRCWKMPVLWKLCQLPENYIQSWRDLTTRFIYKNPNF